MKTTASEETLKKALEKVNKERGYSLSFNRFDRTGKYVNFTLKSPSRVPGSRRSRMGRNLPCASWHAHGYFMEEVFYLDPEAVIYSLGKPIYKGFRWEDHNIGSLMYPMNMSESSIL